MIFFFFCWAVCVGKPIPCKKKKIVLGVKGFDGFVLRGKNHIRIRNVFLQSVVR